MKNEIKEIEKTKIKLINKAKKIGLYENFGQTEVRALEDKFGYTLAIKNFDNWCMNYTPSNSHFNKPLTTL